MADLHCPNCAKGIRLRGKHPGLYAKVRVTCPSCNSTFVGMVETGRLADNRKAGGVGEAFDSLMGHVREMVERNGGARG